MRYYVIRKYFLYLEPYLKAESADSELYYSNMEFNNVTTAPWEAKARELVATDPAFLRPLDPDDMGALAINSAQKAFDDAVAQVNLDVYEIVCEPQTYELLLQMGAAVCRFRGALDADGELDKFGRSLRSSFCPYDCFPRH